MDYNKLNNAEKVVYLFNRKVYPFLLSLVSEKEELSFPELVDAAAEKNNAVRKFGKKLKSFGKLRNLIVHYPDYPRKLIAIPGNDVVNEFAHLAKEIRSPQMVIPKFEKRVTRFDDDDLLVKALGFMKQHDFSQLVVKHMGNHCLLTLEGFAAWMLQQIMKSELSIEHTKIRDVLPHEPPQSYLFLNRNASVYDVEMVFRDSIHQHRPRLFAVIITQNGKASEPPIGLVTPWDFLERKSR